jgi:beta-N-acetylhexosaminidase
MGPQDTWVRDERHAAERGPEGTAHAEGEAPAPGGDGSIEAARRSGEHAVDVADVDRLPTEKIPAPDISRLPTAKVAVPTLVPPRESLTPTVPPRLDRLPPRPPDTIQAAEGRHPRRGPRALVFGPLVVALLLIVAAVPLLRALQAMPTSRAAQPSPTATAPSTPSGPGIADPHAYTWLGNVNSYAERAYVDSIVSKMSLDEELGQMIQVSFYGESAVPQWALDEIARDHIGSVILYRANLATADLAREWTSKLQSAAKIPLLLGTDEEGGGVNRLDGIYGNMTAAWQIAQRNDPNYARQVGQQFAQDIAALGMNSDYAPVVDVDSGTGAAGGELSGRMFGNNAAQVTSLAGAFLQGLQDGHRVVGCLKHFPGLGASTADPHQKLATVDRSLDDLWRVDWAPYKALIDAGQVDMIMSTHVVISAVDPTRPASLSHKVITGILRDQLHYEGVIITDGVYMLQVQGSYTYDQSILYAIQAGNDIVSAATSASGADEALRVLRQGVQSGQISKQQIDDSVRRILLLKLHYGLLAQPPRR